MNHIYLITLVVLKRPGFQSQNTVCLATLKPEITGKHIEKTIKHQPTENQRNAKTEI